MLLVALRHKIYTKQNGTDRLDQAFIMLSIGPFCCAVIDKDPLCKILGHAVIDLLHNTVVYVFYSLKNGLFCSDCNFQMVDGNAGNA